MDDSAAKLKRLAALEKRQSFSPAVNTEAKKRKSDAVLSERLAASSQAEAATSPKKSQRKNDTCSTIYEPLDSSHFQLEIIQTDDSLERERFLEEFVTKVMEKSSNFLNASSVLSGSRFLDKNFLLENPVRRGAAASKAQARQRSAVSKRSKKHLSMKEHKRRGTFEIPLSLRSYTIYERLNVLWLEYIRKLIASCHDGNLAPRFLTADLHGSKIAVVRSSDPTMVAQKGIVAQDSRNALHLITTENKLKVIPKKGCVFEVEVDDKVVQLCGDAMLSRMAAEKQGTWS